MPSHWQLIYYIRLFFICQELFQNFFRSFCGRSFKNQTFLTAVSFETAYLLYQTEIRLSRTFFILFKPLFSSTASPLSDSFNRIPQHSPLLSTKIFSFFQIQKSRYYTHYEQSPKVNSVYAADTQPITAMASISVAIAFITAAFFFILLNSIKTSFINRIYNLFHFVNGYRS